MSRTILHNARVIDPASDYDGPGGVIVEDGIIVDMGPHVGPEKDEHSKMVDCHGLCLAPGLVDLRVKTGEPGSEHRETLASASVAAVAGGITSMVVMPDTDPVIDTPALVDYLRRAGQTDAVRNRVYPAGALSQGLKSERMSELSLMKDAGAVLFTQVDEAVRSSNFLRRSLQYARALDAKIMLRPDDPDIATGSMNASGFAARLGLRGLPKQAEWIGLQRDLTLAEMTGSTMIVDQVTTRRSLEIVEDARARGQKIHVTSAAHSLYFNELDIGDGTRDPDKAYLTYCKVNPPFRSEEDRLALIEGLRDGRLDVIVSAHDPQPPEEKRLPFDEASFGAAGLETLLSALTTLSDQPEYDLDLLTILRAMTVNPADILGLEQGRLAAGAPADLILFDPRRPWKCKRDKLRSRSGNSPFDGRLLTGQVMKTMVEGEWVFELTEDSLT